MKKILIILIAVLLVGFSIKTYFGFKAANQFFKEKKENFFGLKFKVDKIRLDWLRTRIVLLNVNIHPAGNKSSYPLASAKKVIFDLSPFKLIHKQFYVTKIIFEKPKSSYIEYSAQKANWDALNLSELDENSSSKGSDWQIIIDKIVIKDGNFKYRSLVDRSRLELNQVEATITNIVSEPNPQKLPSKISFKSQVGRTKGELNISGRANFLAEGINFKLKARLSEMPVTYFYPFYAGQIPFTIQRGKISGSSDATSVKSNFISYNNIVLKDLKTGGLKGKLVNALVLKNNNRLKIKASAKGNLEEGNITIGSATTRAISDQILAQAMKQTAIGKTGTKVKETGKNIKRKITNIFR
ncbi:MAG: DUF748 domain-containing protein [Pseudomonadota bacterium]